MVVLSYKGHRTSRVQIEEVVSSEVDFAWVMVALCKVSKTATQKWHGKTIEALIHVALDVLENMPDRLIFDEGYALEVFIEEHKPCCFRCGLKGYICATSKTKNTGKEEDGGETTQPVQSHYLINKNGPIPLQTHPLHPTSPEYSQPKKLHAPTKKKAPAQETAPVHSTSRPPSSTRFLGNVSKGERTSTSTPTRTTTGHETPQTPHTPKPQLTNINNPPTPEFSPDSVMETEDFIVVD